MGEIVKLRPCGMTTSGATQRKSDAMVMFEPDPDLLRRTGCDSQRMSRQQLEDVYDKLSAENRRLALRVKRLKTKLEDAKNTLAGLKTHGRKDVTQRRK